MIKHQKLFVLAIVLFLLFPYQAWATKVVVDAGHGGRDPGAIGVNGLQEKDVNLDIALKLRDELSRKGYEVTLTRADDRYISLADRVAFTNAQNADLFVSIHANALKNSSTRGSMVLYYDDRYPQQDYPASDAMKALTPYSEQLAQGVLDSLVSESGTINKGLTPSAVYVVRMGTIPSILVETAFLSNATDAAMLADDSARSRMAIGISKGIELFNPLVFPDTVGHWARASILLVRDKGLVEGLNNRYLPQKALTRAEFVTMMDRLFDFSALAKAAPVQAYKDLLESHWSYPVITKAQALNLLEGYEDNTIRPDSPISRAEVAVLFQRLLAAKATPQEAPVLTMPVFNDVPVNIWYASAVYELRARGIINGATANEFLPNLPVTRAEMAVMMDRYLQK
jgi:N-acetylmuramoyl-L-alanine amidase